MKRGQFIGGLLFLVAAAFIFVGLEGDANLPIAMALTVVGVALIAVSRRRAA